MKSIKTKLGVLLVATSALVLAACGQGESKTSSTTSRAPSTIIPTTSVEPIKRTVTIKDAAGQTISSAQQEVMSTIAKPADPTAPAGQVFYGWKNTKNGGQIWNFEDQELNCVMDDVELVPCFIPASQNVQLFEAELVPDIQEANGGKGMDGATYSGGAKGKQLVGRDRLDEIGATCVSSYSYYEVYESEDDIALGIIDSYAESYEDVTGLVTVKKDVEVDYDGFVHFLYEKGDTLTWKLNASAAAQNVILFARFSAEYGKPTTEAGFDEYMDEFNDQQFKIKVNDSALQYGNIRIHNILGTSGAKFVHCQDYLISASVNLKAGENVIQMVVDNNDTLNGTIAASAPVIDSIKLYTDATVTWPKPKCTNLVIE